MFLRRTLSIGRRYKTARFSATKTRFCCNIPKPPAETAPETQQSNTPPPTTFLESKSGLDAIKLDDERKKLLQAYKKWQTEPKSTDLKRKALESLLDIHDALIPGQLTDELQRLFNLILLPIDDKNNVSLYLFTREEYVQGFIEKTQSDLKFKREEFFQSNMLSFMYQFCGNTGIPMRDSNFKGIQVDPFTPDMLQFSYMDVKQIIDGYEMEEVVKQLEAKDKEQQVDHTALWKAIANNGRCHVILSHRGKMVQFIDSKDKRWFVVFTRESNAEAFRDFYANKYGVSGLDFEVLFGSEIVERVRGESDGCIINMTPYENHVPCILRFKEGQETEEKNSNVREILAPNFIDSHL